MKSRLLIIFVIIGIVGVLQIPESFSEDSIPSCNIGVFVSDNIQCYTKDSPPCTEPSFEKNELCVVKKIDICEKDYVLLDGFCRPSHIRIDDPTFTRQNLLSGKPIQNPDPADFRESGDGISSLYTYSGLSFVGIVIGFFVIKKWKNRK